MIFDKKKYLMRGKQYIKKYKDGSYNIYRYYQYNNIVTVSTENENNIIKSFELVNFDDTAKLINELCNV